MKRRWAHIIALILLFALACPSAFAGKKSRPGKKASKARAVKQSRGKSSIAKRSAKSRRVGRSRARGRAHNAGRRGSRRNRQITRIPVESEETTSRVVAGGIPIERVAEIQAALRRLGYYDQDPSGHYDETTVAAMKEFQAANNLPVTGMPSAFTLKKLGVSKRSGDGYAIPVKSVSDPKQ